MGRNQSSGSFYLKSKSFHNHEWKDSFSIIFCVMSLPNVLALCRIRGGFPQNSARQSPLISHERTPSYLNQVRRTLSF
jgi:hypothetical protein